MEQAQFEVKNLDVKMSTWSRNPTFGPLYFPLNKTEKIQNQCMQMGNGELKMRLLIKG